MKYEDWCAAQGLIDLSSGSPDKKEECVSDEKLQKQIVSLHITLDLIYEFVQKNFISEEYERNIILSKLYAICGHIEESAKSGNKVVENPDKKISAEKTELIKSTEKKETKKLEGGIVNERNTKSAEKMELIKSTEMKETEKLEGGIVKEIIKPSPKKKDKKVSPIKKISPKKKENIKVPKNVTFTDKEEVYELHVETEDDVCSYDTDSVINEDDDIPLSQIQQAAAEMVMHDDMDDIPLSQIKTGDQMVRYRDNLEIDTESDEFSTIPMKIRSKLK